MNLDLARQRSTGRACTRAQATILCPHCSQPSSTSLAEVKRAVVVRDLRSGVDDFISGEHAPLLLSRAL